MTLSIKGQCLPSGFVERIYEIEFVCSVSSQ